jgi:2-polyprenyl-3-methyl-5-hydroxy-6-metoxy-1,4-benzoquinol methylase
VKESNRLRHRLRRAAVDVINLPTGVLQPWVLPGAPAFYKARWEWTLRRRPVVSGAEHAARTGVGEIEEIIACDLCGQQRFQPLFHAYAGKRNQHRYHVVRCPDCGFLYRQPGIRPERLGDLYSSGRYGRFLVGKYSRKRQRRYELVMDAFAPLLADGAGRRLLDVGCGAGLFLEIAHRRGFDCHGVDLSADSIEHARTQPWGANTYHGAPQDVPEIASGGFDVITLWSVLAHLAQPVEDFALLRSLLAPDGVLLVLTVNANSLYLKQAGEHWNGFTPNHLKFFSPATLERLLAKTGFSAVTMPPMPPDSVAAGRTTLTPRRERRLLRATERGNTGNMLRAVAYNAPETPERWGITRHTRPLAAAGPVVAPLVVDKA